VVPPDLVALKTRQQAMWASGDYGQIGIRLQLVGESLCEAVDLLATERVLDVAAGNGNVSLAAARRFAEVTAADYVPALLEQAQRRAQAERLEITFVPADAENLPFADASYDVALSVFGVMFAPDQERAAAELLRVVRPGGRIGLASWTPDSFIGQLLKVVTRFVPPPAGVRSPLAWGTETRLVELFGPGAHELRTERRTHVFRYRSAHHFVADFRTYYGPTHKAFAALDEDRQEELRSALMDLLATHDRGGGKALVVPSEYLEAVIVR
jgi:SAM-dependent methyltransferase